MDVAIGIALMIVFIADCLIGIYFAMTDREPIAFLLFVNTPPLAWIIMTPGVLD